MIVNVRFILKYIVYLFLKSIIYAYIYSKKIYVEIWY